MTEKYAIDESAVWNIAELKSLLLETSFSKCAYCEVELGVESKYLEIDHFFDKKRHPTRVVEWENLIPSCKRCNIAKGTHNVATEPILNPYTTDPREHIAFKLYRLRHKTLLGQSTVDVLNLNDQSKIVQMRFEIGEKIQSLVQDSRERLTRFRDDPSTRNKNRLLSQIRGLLIECITPASYAATSATILHNDMDYIQLVKDMMAEALWNDEMAGMHSTSRAIKLDYI